jgi:hypothetical protein
MLGAVSDEYLKFSRFHEDTRWFGEDFWGFWKPAAHVSDEDFKGSIGPFSEYIFLLLEREIQTDPR